MMIPDKYRADFDCQIKFKIIILHFGLFCECVSV